MPGEFKPSEFTPSEFTPSEFTPSEFMPSEFMPSEFMPSEIDQQPDSFDAIDAPLEGEDGELERYELREPPRYRFSATRREFGQSLGLGLLVVASAQPAAAQRRGRRARRDESFSERFHLAADGTVTVLTGKVDVGQGSRTQIAQAAAEELRLDVDRVNVVMADSDRCPDDGGTAGSRTTPSTVPRVRNSAAALRELLIRVVEQKFNVARRSVSYDNGLFTADNDNKITLGEIAGDDQLVAKINQSKPTETTIVPVDQWKVLGTSTPRVGSRQVVTGQAKYPSDIQLPGMLYGKVLRPACYGAELTSIDLDAAGVSQDVKVVRDGSFVGCVAASSWQAQQACDALSRSCQWNRPPHPSSDELFDHLRRTARNDSNRNRDRWGAGVGALQDSASVLEASYTIAYAQHAPMEPRAAVADWSDGQLTVWTGTQQPDRVHRELSEVFRLSTDKVRLIAGNAGGGFGGKHTGESAIEAARLSKAVGKPVSLRWTREEELTWAYFRPAGIIDVKAGLDADGRLHAWDFSNYNSGGSAIETPYRVPHGQTRFVSCDAPLRQGSYRALASTANAFARESAMDELAAMANVDPLEFRLRHLDDGRLKDVLRAAAEKFRWSDRRAAAGDRGIGLGCGTEKGSFVATCAEVEVVGGQVRVIDVCQAFECGAVHNPRNVASQSSGCLIMGMGPALFEAIEFAGGRISNASFSSYRVPRMRDVPSLELVQLNRRDLPSVGAGETPIIGIAPAIANAACRASGIRSRSMPLMLG